MGAGFIGVEVAAVARTLGLAVTMVEALAAPFARALGPEVGGRCAQPHEEHGVRLITSAQITDFAAGGGSAALRLADGRVLESDCVLVGVGTTPNTTWLAGTGLDTTNGVRCDHAGRVEGVPNMFAVGDVAAWQSTIFGDRPRVEHWTNASEQAHSLARSMLGGPPARTSHDPPYFWSDQYRTKLQLVGRPELSDRVEVLDLPGKPGRLLGLYFRSSRLVAAVTFGAPAVLARYRPLVSALADEEATAAVTRDLAGNGDAAGSSEPAAPARTGRV